MSGISGMPPAGAAGIANLELGSGIWVVLFLFGHARKTATKRPEPPNISNAD